METLRYSELTRNLQFFVEDQLGQGGVPFRKSEYWYKSSEGKLCWRSAGIKMRVPGEGEVMAQEPLSGTLNVPADLQDECAECFG